MQDNVGEGIPAKAISVTSGQEGGQSAWAAAKKMSMLLAMHSLSETWDQDAWVCTPCEI